MWDALRWVQKWVEVHVYIYWSKLVLCISMKSMKTVVFDSSFVARLGRYAKTKCRIKYFEVGEWHLRTTTNLQSAFISILVGNDINIATSQKIETSLISVPSQNGNDINIATTTKRIAGNILIFVQIITDNWVSEVLVVEIFIKGGWHDKTGHNKTDLGHSFIFVKMKFPDDFAAYGIVQFDRGRFANMQQWWHLYMNENYEIFSNDMKKYCSLSFWLSLYLYVFSLSIFPCLFLLSFSLPLPLFLFSLSSHFPSFPYFFTYFDILLLPTFLSLSHSLSFSLSALSLSFFGVCGVRIEIIAESGCTSWHGHDCNIELTSWRTMIVHMGWPCYKLTWQWLITWDGYVISCPRNDRKHGTVIISWLQSWDDQDRILCRSGYMDIWNI